MMFKSFLSQLRENPRLRWGVVLIIGTCWLYGLLLLRDQLQEETRQYRAAALSLERLRTQLTQTEWLTRVDPAKTLAVQLEGRLWQAPTSGLAQAAFQDALNSAMVKAGVTRPQISVTVIEEAGANATTNAPDQNQAGGGGAPADLWKVKAKLSHDFSAPSLFDLMGQIDGHPKQIVVDSINVAKEPQNRVDMELYAYFQKPTAPAPKRPQPIAPI